MSTQNHNYGPITPGITTLHTVKGRFRVLSWRVESDDPAFRQVPTGLSYQHPTSQLLFCGKAAES